MSLSAGLWSDIYREEQKEHHSPYTVSNIHIYTGKKKNNEKEWYRKITFFHEKQTKGRPETVHEQNNEEERIHT